MSTQVYQLWQMYLHGQRETSSVSVAGREEMGYSGKPHSFYSVFLWARGSSTNSSLCWKSTLSHSQVVGCISCQVTLFPIAQVLTKPSPLELWTWPTLWWSSGDKSVQLISILSPGKRESMLGSQHDARHFKIHRCVPFTQQHNEKGILHPFSMWKMPMDYT